MKTSKNLLLSLCLCASAEAANIPPELGGLLGGFIGGGGSSASSIQALVLSAGLTYAKRDPRWSVVLAALGINNAQDLEKFIKGDGNGNNFQDILVHAAFQYAQGNPKFTSWFAKVGVVDEPSLKGYLNGKGSQYQDLIFDMALQYAQSNPKYASWLEKLDIHDLSDLQDIYSGGLQGTNLQEMLLSLGLQYMQSNPKYAQYMAIVTLLIGNGTLPGVGTGNPLDLFLGAYDGLPVSEIKTIQKAKKFKAKRRT